MIKKTLLVSTFASLAALGQGCFHSSHEVDIKPVEIKPMHITIDVNVKVEKQLTDFFEEIDRKAERISSQEKKMVTPSDVTIAAPTQISTSTSTQINDKK